VITALNEAALRQKEQNLNIIHKTHSWSIIKLDRNGLQFFYRYTLEREWEWLSIVKPPQVKRIPDIITNKQIGLLISHTYSLRYQVFFLVLYSMKKVQQKKVHDIHKL